MFYFKVRVPGRLTDITVKGNGATTHTQRGDVCSVPSVVSAQQLARLFRGYGLLG